MLNVVKSFWNDKRGSFAVQSGVVSFVLLMATGAAVDYNSLASERDELQAWADSTALAAAVSGLTEDADLQSFSVDFMKTSPFPSADINTRVNGGKFVVELSNRKDLLFMDSFGQDTANIYVESEVMIPTLATNSNTGRIFNIALVFDTTQSMVGLGRLQALREATHDFLDGIEENASSETMVSLIPFSSYVRIPTTNRNELWIDVPSASTNPEAANSTDDWEGCMNSRKDGGHIRPDFLDTEDKLQGFYEGAACSEDLNNELVPLTTNFDLIRVAVNNLLPRGTTYLPSGLIWGWRTLSPNAPFTEAATNPNAEDVLILITDGSNTVSLNETNELTHSNGLYHEQHPTGGSRLIANALTLDLCTGMKNRGVTVFAIAFRVGSSDSETRQLLKSCATQPEFFYDAAQNNDLLDRFKDIERDLNAVDEIVRLTR